MNPAIRKGIGVFAACGLAASVSAYIGSFVGLTMDGIRYLAIALYVGIFVLIIGTQRNYRILSNERFSLKGLLKGTPPWVLSTFWLLVMSYAVHFLLFAAESHMAMPDIKNGEYMLGGQVITQHEYFHLKSAELRLFAMLWMLLYYALTAFWWFPRSTEAIGENAFPEAGI